MSEGTGCSVVCQWPDDRGALYRTTRHGESNFSLRIDSLLDKQASFVCSPCPNTISLIDFWFHLFMATYGADLVRGTRMLH